MGRHNDRAVKAIKEINSLLIGAEMLERLRESIMLEPIFQILFGNSDDKKDPLKSRIFLNKTVSYNETILPAWEMRFQSEKVQGDDLLMPGRINSRILFGDGLQEDLNFHRNVAMAISRFFNSIKRLDDFLRKVPGLTEFAENLDIRYDLLFVHGGKKTPVITMGMDYIFDLNRFRAENECVDLDARLDAALLQEAIYRLEISGEDEVTGKTEILIPASN